MFCSSFHAFTKATMLTSGTVRNNAPSRWKQSANPEMCTTTKPEMVALHHLFLLYHQSTDRFRISYSTVTGTSKVAASAPEGTIRKRMTTPVTPFGIAKAPCA